MKKKNMTQNPCPLKPNKTQLQKSQMFDKIIDWIYKHSNKSQAKQKLKGDIILGIIVGIILGIIGGIIGSIIVGIIWSIIVGIILGIIWGIIGGIIGGITWGIIGGIIWGIGSVIGISIVSFFHNIPQNYLLLIIILLALMEIKFWLFDKAKPKENKENKSKFTLKRKLISLPVAAFIEIEFFGLINLYNEVYPKIKQYFPEILKWMIALSVILFIFYLWIKINENKYD